MSGLPYCLFGSSFAFFCASPAGVAVVSFEAAPLPVVLVSRLFGDVAKNPERLIIVRAGPSRVGLAVDTVVGVRALSGEMLQRLPLLMRDASHNAVEDIGTLDGELMVVLQAGRVVPADIFAIVEAEVATS